MKSIVVLATVVSLIGSGAAGARERLPKVDIGDLQLTSLSGAAIALQRAQDAARVFCRRQKQPSQYVDLDTLRCRSAVTGKVVRRINAPLVNALYDATLYAENGATFG